MITEVRAKNCFVFSDEIKLSMEADMRNKRLGSNVASSGEFNVLKVSEIYGANNSGKTCIVKCIRAFWGIVKSVDNILSANLFTKNPVAEIGITFLNDSFEYSYDLAFDTSIQEFVFEKFSQISKDEHGNRKETNWLLRNGNDIKCIDTEIESMSHLISKKNILMHLIDVTMLPHLNDMKTLLINLADKIDIVESNNIPLNKTIEILKRNDAQHKKIVDFAKQADLHLDNIYYADMKDVNINLEKPIEANEQVLNIPDQIFELVRLVSVYKGIPVPSLLHDSTGTKKIIALASFIIDALENGKILIVDELDSSLHFKLTKAIVSLFNNELNNSAQLIFTSHDVSLLDCKKMFRKEQIWFVHKDYEKVYVYSLSDFTAADGVRDTTDIVEKYKKGILGALPNPSLIESLISIYDEKGGDVCNET